MLGPRDDTSRKQMAIIRTFKEEIEKEWLVNDYCKVDLSDTGTIVNLGKLTSFLLRLLLLGNI